MLYFKILLDKHDYRQLNTLQDLNNQLKQGAQNNNKTKGTIDSKGNTVQSQCSDSREFNQADH